jgi:hypothetical protein
MTGIRPQFTLSGLTVGAGFLCAFLAIVRCSVDIPHNDLRVLLILTSVPLVGAAVGAVFAGRRGGFNESFEGAIVGALVGPAVGLFIAIVLFVAALPLLICWLMLTG